MEHHNFSSFKTPATTSILLLLFFFFFFNHVVLSKGNKICIPFDSYFLYMLYHLSILINSEMGAEDFSYTNGSRNGPCHWGDIKKDWEFCNKGKMQSPINLDSKKVQYLSQLGDLKWRYRSADAVMKNVGHAIMLKWEKKVGEMCINRTKFSLQQVHWHTPSEHTIDGHRYSLELHMVHQRATDNKTAVVAILYSIGRPDPFLAKVMKNIKMVSGKNEGEVKAGLVNPRDIKMGSRNYYRYSGSLTTPPCTQGVIWTIIKKVRSASRHQIRVLKEAVEPGFKENARPLQPINA